MAKSVIDAVRRRAGQPLSQPAPARAPVVGRGVVGFKKAYSQDEWEKIEADRRAMRARLRAEG